MLIVAVSLGRADFVSMMNGGDNISPETQPSTIIIPAQGAFGTFANKTVSPSAIVGCVKIASRNVV
jgi:hypothetical protein